MLCWILLFFALLFLPLGALTVFRSPDWSEWKLALLAGDFGHWLVLGPILIALLAVFSLGGHGVFRGAIVVLCLIDAALLLKPSMQARQIAVGLPAALEQAFGPVHHALEAPPFSVAGFFHAAPRSVLIETRKFSDELELDFYRSAFGGGRVPCVLVVHGGGWDSGDRTQLDGFNHWLAREGYAVAAIDYRLAPQAVWPAQRDDVRAAIAWLKGHAAELGIDATRLILLGRSAGGQIASAVAYTENDPAIRGLVALYSPHDMFFAYKYARDDDVLKSPQLLRAFLGGAPDAAAAAYDSASAYLHTHAGVPPTLLIHGAIDTLVWYKQSERLDAKLTEAGVPHVFVALPWATHAFDYNLSGPGGQLTAYALRHFLSVVTK
jgi:acetyl esterase/lipase